MEDNVLNNQEIKEEKTSKRKKTKKAGKKRFIFITILAVILCVLAWLYMSSFETTDDAFIEGHIIRISPKVTGTIENLYVDDNDFVQKGISLRTQNDTIFAELHIIVTYGLNISAICQSITNKVKYTVEEATGMQVAK